MGVCPENNLVLIVGQKYRVEKSNQQTYDHYAKALMDISQAITSDLFLEDLFKLIVMVTGRSLAWKSAHCGLLTKMKTLLSSG